MTIYVVDNYNTCELEAFEDLEEAAFYVRQYYIDHMADMLGDSNGSVESALQTIKADLENLNSDHPYIENVMHIRDTILHY